MAHRVLIAVLLVTAFVRSAEASCEDPFADPNEVVDLHLRLARADWDGLRDDPATGLGCDAQFPYFEADFRCGAGEWLRVGVRRKRGDQRGKDTNEKPSIKLDFNRLVAGQRWPAELGELGFRRLSLNNGQEDNPGGVLSALLSEHLAWRLMVAEVPRASRVAYASLTIHFPDGESEYHGLYILIEDIDRTAIRRRFGTDAGRLLKTTSGSCRDQVVFDDGNPNGASQAFDAWSALDPADFPGAWSSRSNEALDLDELLRAEAIRDVLANGADTVLGRNHSNYYSFDSLDPGRSRRHYLPWDLDDVFRPFPQDVAPTAPLERDCSPVGELTRCEPEIRAAYLEIACQLANGTLSGERLLAELGDLDAIVRPLVAAEIANVWSPADPLDETIDGTYAAEFLRMQDWIPARIDSVRSQIEDLGVACADGCASGEVIACAFADCAGERRCVDGRWTTCEVDPASEVPGNLADDDCDTLIDETNPDDPAPPDDPETTTTGCACQTGDGGAPSAALLLLAVFARVRKRVT